MTPHTLIGHTLNSGYSWLQLIRPDLDAAPTVLLTQVPYTDDPQMRARLAQKRAEYPADASFLYEPHDWLPSLTNVTDGQDLIIDSVNLWVSNLMLLLNSQPEHREHLYARIERTLNLFADFLDRHTNAFRRIYWITSEVDHDPFIRSPLGQEYHMAIHHTNAFIQNTFSPRRGILLNGHPLWAGHIEQPSEN